MKPHRKLGGKRDGDQVRAESRTDRQPECGVRSGAAASSGAVAGRWRRAVEAGHAAGGPRSSSVPLSPGGVAEDTGVQKDPEAAPRQLGGNGGDWRHTVENQRSEPAHLLRPPRLTGHALSSGLAASRDATVSSDVEHSQPCFFSDFPCHPSPLITFTLGHGKVSPAH